MLNPDDLLSSSVVANAIMNRGRGFSGVNSYGRELRFDIGAFLERRVRERGEAVWLDACCGQGRALLEAGRQFAGTDWGSGVRIAGVDLVGMFEAGDAPNVRLIAGNVAAFKPDAPVDLITCVHGLHCLGDKLGFLESAYAMLEAGGMFLGSLDSQNVRGGESRGLVWRQATAFARRSGVAPDLKSHVLRLDRSEARLDFGLSYAGATVSEKPNYSGITVVDSWYASR